ncbi:MAG TPA: hypothetical protein VGN42_25425 [Pirellulales bacterium]|jgi:hypothetical protein|nr:hypothetical protein [Pirellulales bacterium]
MLLRPAAACQAFKLDPPERHIADAADMAKIIRGEKKADSSYEHDAAVQETVLRAAGLMAGA